ncbi:SRPBCC family protein [Cribrihabitans neustonicus]|uniref:SRPBCC family protein n=1 Tax=Cribrihabitans neustonicus TaxID=1429085 RepID=UPI003B5B8FDC
MKFHSKADIDAPIARVFEALADFEHLERAAVRRGLEVHRTGDIAAPGEGLAWDLRFEFRGKPRDIRLVLKDYSPVTGLELQGSGSGVDGIMRVALAALSPRSTRMAVDLELSASTLPGRLMLQSLKLARSKLKSRFKQRLRDYAALTEERLKRTA